MFVVLSISKNKTRECMASSVGLMGLIDVLYMYILLYACCVCVCVYVCVCVCVCALRKVTGSDSTSRKMPLLSLGDGDCRPKRGCPVSWHP